MTEPWLALIAGLAGVALGFPLVGVSEGLLRARRLFSWRVRAAASISCGLLFAIVAAVLGLVWELPAYLYLACAAVVLGIVDLAEKRLPNAIVHPSLVVLPVLLLCAAALRGAWPQLLGAVEGAGALFAVYLVLALISPAGIGMGDVKLSALLGLALGYLGFFPLLIGGAAGFVVGGLVSLIALLARRVTLRSSIPFGPAMLVGAFVGLLLS